MHAFPKCSIRATVLALLVAATNLTCTDGSVAPLEPLLPADTVAGLAPGSVANRAATAPVIGSFEASVSKVPAGTEVTLSWSVTAADSLFVDQGVGTVTGTSTAVIVDSTTTYTLTAASAQGAATAAVTIRAGPVPVINSLSAFPPAVAPGTEVQLLWDADHASRFSIPGEYSYIGSSFRDAAVTPNSTTTYKLIAHNTYGKDTASVAVKVGTAPVISSFTASPGTVAAGTTTTLSLVRDRGGQPPDRSRCRDRHRHIGGGGRGLHDDLHADRRESLRCRHRFGVRCREQPAGRGDRGSGQLRGTVVCVRRFWLDRPGRGRLGRVARMGHG